MIDNLSLNPLTLRSSALRRDRAVRPAKRGACSDSAYDTDTLAYDVIQTGTGVHLVCPLLLNLRTVLRRARFTLDGRPAGRPRIRTFYRHSIVTLPTRTPVSRIGIEGEALTLEGPVSQAAPDSARFAGLNCEMLISKNNSLDWIATRLRHHVRHHGLQAVLFLDNGSTDYSTEDLRAVLAGSGLTSGAVVACPFPWGPVNLRPFRHRELFLQTAIYNVARLRFLGHARAVLRMDVDEVLHDPAGRTVFDEAVASRLGYVQINGRMRYPAPGSQPPFDYPDHLWRRQSDPLGGGNWCVVPDGPLERFQWRCHNLETFPLTMVSRRPGSWYFDCQGITTGWKNPDRWAHDEALLVDEEAERFFGPDGTFRSG